MVMNGNDFETIQSTYDAINKFTVLASVTEMFLIALYYRLTEAMILQTY